MWACPDCDRRFGRRGQSHECAPAMSIDEYFETGPEFERPIFEAVRAHFDQIGAQVWIEPVSVGIFFKAGSSFLQLRTMTRWVAVSFHLPRRLEHSRLSRKVQEHHNRFWHVVNVRSADEVDDVLLDWLTEAWQADTERA